MIKQPVKCPHCKTVALGVCGSLICQQDAAARQAHALIVATVGKGQA
jgi:hypothetical protein